MDSIDVINMLLKNRKLTGTQMCRDLGLSPSVYSQWNTRRTKPSKAAIAAVAAYLCTSPEFIETGVYGKSVTGKIVLDDRRAEIIKRVEAMSEEELSRVEDILKHVTSGKE